MVKDFRQEFINDVVKKIESEEFRKENTTNDSDGGFTRKRKLTFTYLIILITQGLTRSIQRELNSFYQKIKGGDFSLQEVTKSAFTHARKKLKWEAFKELNKTGIESFYKNGPFLKWNNYRLLSIDGSTIVLPTHESIEQEFGSATYGKGEGRVRSIAKISMLYDVLNYTTLDAEIARNDSDERKMALQHLNYVVPGQDLLILDRGYPSYGLVYELQQKKVDFCIRLRGDWWLDVRKMVQEGETDKVITVKLNKRDWDLIEKYDAETDEVSCRVVIVPLPDGGTEILCTSLLDAPIEVFPTLYHYRWNIEEGYKLYKCRLGLEEFSGKTSTAVRQDFFAKVFMMTTTAVMAFPIEEKLKEEQKQTTRKHTYKVNRTNALSMVKEVATKIFMGKWIKESLKALDNFLKKTVEIVRPNRKVERTKTKKKPPSMNYKSL